MNQTAKIAFNFLPVFRLVWNIETSSSTKIRAECIFEQQWINLQNNKIFTVAMKTTPVVAVSKWQERPLSLTANISAMSNEHKILLVSKWHLLKRHERLQIVLISSKHKSHSAKISLSLGEPLTFVQGCH